uniref:tRNA-splicing endonuclease subunit Sen2 n=1 Tax=Latimeria chalumnae TaxID=7897 RepID=H3AIX8_LATCH
MAEAVFCAPRRKRRVFETYEASLPVPTTQEEANLSIPRVYQAELFNNHVIVRHPGDIEVLYKKKGYFGKGILSRSKPEYYVSDPLLAAKWKGINVTRMPVISSAKYQHHVDWARSILQEQGLDQCTVNKTLADYTQQIDISFHMLDEKNKKSTKRNCCTAAEVTGVENSQAASDPTLASERKNSCSGTDQAIVPTLGTGNTLYDPLAKYKCNDPDQVDIEASAKVHCHKHDDLIVDCGCRNEDLIKELFHKHSPKDSEFPPDHEYVLVQEEEEHLANENEGLGKNLVKENLVCRRNPYRIFEYLQLSLEEAFFLVYALGCLTVYYEEITIIFKYICTVNPPPFFRCVFKQYGIFALKWIKRAACSYSKLILLLYRKGPPFYHASFSVVVEMVDYCYQGVPRRPFSWRSLCGLNRITANVSKELLLCYLIKPSDMTDEDLSSPECMRRIKVQELLLNRWVSSRERTEQDEI